MLSLGKRKGKEDKAQAQLRLPLIRGGRTLARHHAPNGRSPSHHAGPRPARPPRPAQTFYLPGRRLVLLRLSHRQFRDQEAAPWLAPQRLRRRRCRRRRGRGRRGATRWRRGCVLRGGARGGNGLPNPPGFEDYWPHSLPVTALLYSRTVEESCFIGVSQMSRISVKLSSK